MGYSYENNKIHKTANKEWILTSVNLKWYKCISSKICKSLL